MNDRRSMTPKERLWQARNAIVQAARQDYFIAGAMDVAGQSGLTGDSIFVAVAAELVAERQKIMAEMAAAVDLASENKELRARVEELENQGTIRRILRWRRG